MAICMCFYLDYTHLYMLMAGRLFFLMIRRPPRSTLDRSSAASDVYKRQFLAWATLRAGSVWPAVIGHAAINGISALGALVVQGNPSSLLGPLPVGLLGSLGWAAVAGWIWWRHARGDQLADAPEAVANR